MNTFPNACPHCDAGPGPYVNSYLCGTYLRAGHDARKHQTKRCVTRQLLVWVEKARKAEARCKRLEEAVSAYQAAYEPDGHVRPHDCFATGPKTGDPIQDLVACPGCFAARKAKEAKP